MQPFITLTSSISVLPHENIDTDQLMPARFMKEPRKPLGYGQFLLHDFGREALIEKAGILCAKRNFGCGSSREAAVYALVDSGITCVIAPSFGDIFKTNAVKNGVLPAIVKDVEPLLSYKGIVTVDLPNQIIVAGEITIQFEIETAAKTQLLEGLDDIGITLKLMPKIDAFMQAYYA